MSPNIRRFDVYLSGAKDKSPSAQMRLVGTIAARYRLPATAIAAALEGGPPCLLTEAREEGEAQALVATLGGLGALTRLVPTAKPIDEQLTPVARKDHRITLKTADVHMPVVVDVSEPIEFAERGPEAATGVRGSDTARCHIHGLVYNRRKASGCMRCLADARARARKLQEQAGTDGGFDHETAASFRQDPVKRAFWGLAVALVLGFLPAAYFARAINHRQVVALRGQQAALSEAIGGDVHEAIRRYDELDTAVEALHRSGTGRTLLIWLATGALAGLVWTRLTRPPPFVPNGDRRSA